MSSLSATVEGIGFWCNGLPDWPAARAYAKGAGLPDAAPARPSPQVLAPNERRRAPESVAVALEVALAACTDAQHDPATLASVFASTHGDLAITDYMCSTLVADPRALSPTRFHNSVHNAAAGPLARVSTSQGVLGGALVLSRTPRAGMPTLRVTLEDGTADQVAGALAQREQANAMAQMLPLFDALAAGHSQALLHAGRGRVLRVEISHD
jgi:hypothetical protein